MIYQSDKDDRDWVKENLLNNARVVFLPPSRFDTFDIYYLPKQKLDENGNDRSKTIVKNVINLSNELKLTTLTEDVETKQQYSDLIDMGCVLFQGYYFAKPMPVDEFEKFLEEQT